MQNCTKKLPILEEVEFQEHKILTLDIIDKYQYFNKNKSINMTDCGQRLQFGLYENIQTLEQQKHLEEMYTCKDRFCAFCNWRRARKLGIQAYAVLKAIESENKVRYIFATFTVRNCHINDLSDTIKLMNKAFARMIETKRYKNSILGFMRALEFPPQKDNNEYIHPHFHCLFVVPAKYFDTKHNLYIKQEEWITMWQKALRVDYAPSVDIRIIKAKGEADPIAKAVAETVKYPLKTMDLKSMSVDLFKELVEQMKRKRALAFGGIVKEYRKKLILDDVEDGDLIYDDLKNEEIWKRIKTLLYEFKNGDYGLQYYEKVK
jgi:plasmid rolling circle replication initiator protein Rep